MREASARDEQLGLTDEEIAFYDALETNCGAVQVLGDETLCAIARELVETVDILVYRGRLPLARPRAPRGGRATRAGIAPPVKPSAP